MYPSLTAVSVQEPKPKHVLVFQHIPLYLKSPDEEDDYFNLQKAVRQNLLDRFKRAGRTQAMDFLYLFPLVRLTEQVFCLRALQHEKFVVSLIMFVWLQGSYFEIEPTKEFYCFKSLAAVSGSTLKYQ